LLEIKELSKSFDGFKAVSNANLKVKKGEIAAVIGPNGAGKTTLFNLISGILKPESGRVIYKNEDITALPPYKICRKGICRSFQVVNIFQRLTVLENVQVSVFAREGKTWNLFTPSKKNALDKTMEILKSVNIDSKSNYITSRLSHGERKVLEIAIALAGEPELLILDEPTAGMSPEETAVCINLIKNLRDNFGLTILFCEHDMDIVFSIADSIMVMVYGETVIQGSSQEVKGNKSVQDAYLGGSENA